jgi:ATP-dependent helicase STH1/SNF2
LYRNGLNGCLADEMGLGKTVQARCDACCSGALALIADALSLSLRQVIALLCHLVQAEAGLARGPFLIVVPSSVLPNWAAELARWAPTLSVVTYSGPEPARAATYAQTIARGRFQVCLTTFEMMMGVKDVPRLSRVKWAYLVMDEARHMSTGMLV